MSGKPENFAAPASKTVKTQPSSSKTRIPPSARRYSILNKANTTLMGDGDATMMKQEGSSTLQHQIIHGKFLRAILEECIVDDKLERDETQMEIQIAKLADRFQKTTTQLDKTNRRLKDINYVVEQKRLLDLKSNDCTQYYEIMDNYNTENILKDLCAAEQVCLDKLETRNMDFGYDKDSGYKKLLDAVNDATEGLENIKKHSKFDLTKFKEYEKTDKSLNDLEKDRFDIESLKSEFETNLPLLSEKLMKEASERIGKMMEQEGANI